MRVLLAIGALVVIGSILRWYQSPNRPAIRWVAHHAALAVELSLAAPVSAAVLRSAHDRALNDDWTTFAHDDLRSGYERADTGITTSSVAKLKRRWLASLHEPVHGSLLAVAGMVYVATEHGNVYALDAASGEVRWKQNVGNSVRMTPALVGGTLFVGTYGWLGVPGAKPHGASFEALDPRTGAIRWRTPLPGLVRSEPVVVDGVVYEGLAGGDAFSGCFNGRVIALDERTGKPLNMVWMTSRKPNNGGGVWGPLSTDGTTIYVGTGNTCDDGDSGDLIVALTRSLKTVWQTSAKEGNDSDVGSGIALAGRYAYVAGKSGYLYKLDRSSGRILRRTDLESWSRSGGSYSTPTGDGSVLVISGGEYNNPEVSHYPGCIITAFGPDGSARYRFTTAYPVHGYAAFVTGVGFIILDRRIVAFDATTGDELWSDELADYSYASPVVVPSGVYTVTNAGDVHAFGLSEDELAKAPAAPGNGFR